MNTYTIQGRLPERIITLVIPEEMRDNMDGDDFREMIAMCAPDIAAVQAVINGVKQWEDMENWTKSAPVCVEVQSEQIWDSDVTIEGEEFYEDDEG